MVHRLDAKVALDVTRLEEKVAMITGGGSGIGRAIALACGREGARVAVLGRRQDALRGVVKELEQAGAAGIAVVCDVSRREDTRRVVDEVEQKFGSVNVLVNNAGILNVSTAETISEED
jgi:NAD(P)-dependent dehydrogenase (short-subunit alcohol dehydrogenase family)